MRLDWIVALGAAALLPAQGNQKPNQGKPQPAAAAAATAGHASLDALQKDFREKKLVALAAYVNSHATAKDADAALIEAVEIATNLGLNDEAVKHADRYLKDHGTKDMAGQVKMMRAGALRNNGDVAGAEKALREIVDAGGKDIRLVVDAGTTLAYMLAENGKKDEAKQLLSGIGTAYAQAQGLKGHLENISDSIEKIGSDPIAIDKPDTDGKAINLAEYKDKVVLLDFWATWCGPCVAEMPNVIAAYEKYHDKGFEIVGISLDEDRAAFDTFIADKKMTWRQHYDGNGWKNEVAVAYGVQSIPATYLIGRDGKVLAMNLRGEELLARLEKLFAAKAPAAPAAAPAPGKGKSK